MKNEEEIELAIGTTDRFLTSAKIEMDKIFEGHSYEATARSTFLAGYLHASTIIFDNIVREKIHRESMEERKAKCRPDPNFT